MAAERLTGKANLRGIRGQKWDNNSGAGRTLATSPGTSTDTHPLRGRASRG